jgi:hypothetical protein
MSFWRNEKLSKEYQGSADVLSNLNNIIRQNPKSQVTFGYTPTVEGLLNQAGMTAQGIGTSPLTGLANQYFSDLLSGTGLNPYEAGSPYQHYQQAAVQNFQENVLPQIATGAAAKGLLRGSSAERSVSRSSSQLANALQQQAYGAYQQGLQRQYGAAQFVPQQQLAEQQARLSGLLGVGQGYSNLGQMLAGIQQQNIGNQMNAGQLVNAQYGYPQYEASGLSKLIGGVANIGGQALGAAGAAGGFGNLFSGLFGGGQQQQLPAQNNGNPTWLQNYNQPNYRYSIY